MVFFRPLKIGAGPHRTPRLPLDPGDSHGGLLVARPAQRPPGALASGSNGSFVAWQIMGGQIRHPTWRIIPFSKWLITMVSKSPK